MIFDICIKAIPNGEYSPKDGPAFKPYESSPEVWVLQVRTSDGKTVSDWMPVPIVRGEK